MKDEVNKTFYFLGKIAFVVGIVGLIIWKLNPFDIVARLGGCALRRATGLYCPGCGGTRAVRALLAFRPLKSLYYNAAVPYFALVYVCFMVKMFLLEHFGKPDESGEIISFGKLKEHPGRLEKFLYVGVGVLIVQWVVKLVFLLCFNLAWLR